MLYLDRSVVKRTICEMGVGLASIRGRIVSNSNDQLHQSKAREGLKHTIHLLSASASPILPICQALYGEVNRPFSACCNQCILPVLKGGTSPPFVFQKFSR